MLNLARLLQSLLSLGLHALADLLVLVLSLLALSSSAKGGTVVSFIPLSERSGIDLHDGRFGQGVGTDEFVVGRVVGDDNDTDFAGNSFASPAEVTAFQTQGSVFGVAASSADKVNSLVADTGVGWLTAFLERSNLDCVRPWHLLSILQACVSPLLAVVGALRTSCGPLVTAVS